MKYAVTCAVLLQLFAFSGPRAAAAVVAPPGEGTTGSPRAEYVAIGSSFVSGPGVSVPAADGLEQCRQSSANYPRLLAHRLQLSLFDESCAGATTAHVLHGGQFGHAAQVDAVTSSTKLVTVTVGGNDMGFMSNLGAWSCARKPEILPSELRELACQAGRSDAAVDAALAELGGHLRQITDEVRRRSPQARVVFVDYTTVLPAQGHCPDRLPISDEELQRGRAMETKLAEVTAQAARESGASIVRASAVTRGHDVCSKDPWVSEWTFPPTLTTWAPGAYHPTEKAMHAIADAVWQALCRPAAGQPSQDFCGSMPGH
jgi:lysophospholipase L1-like esterase